jgi:hypothetical protein
MGLASPVFELIKNGALFDWKVKFKVKTSRPAFYGRISCCDLALGGLKSLRERSFDLPGMLLSIAGGDIFLSATASW